MLYIKLSHRASGIVDVEIVSQSVVYFHILFSNQFSLDTAVIPIPNFNFVLRLFVHLEYRPTGAIVIGDLLDDLAEALGKVVATTTCIQKVI